MTAFFDLFSGIAGFALAAYWAGLRFDKHYFSEIEPYAIELYKKRFPEAEYLGDIKNVDYSKLPKGEYLVTSGFPCQPHSDAGLKKGDEDERDLWPECRRMLRCLRPRIALFENVRGLLTSPGKDRKGEFFNGVLSDISESGYDAEWQVISATDVGAPHLRKRVWIVAYAGRAGIHEQGIAGNAGEGRGRQGSVMANSESLRRGDGNDGADEGQADREIDAFADAGIPCGEETLADSDIEGLQGRLGGGLQECSGEQPVREGGTSMADTGDIGAVKRQRELQSDKQTVRGRENNGAGAPVNAFGEWWAVEPGVGRVAHGIPSRVDRLKGLGNAIVPQCAEMIFNLPAFDRWRISV